MLVMKFGGTSVGDAERIGRVADLIVGARREDPQLVVVVSAMSGVTNALFAAARTSASGGEAEAQERLKSLLARHLEATRALLTTPQEREAVESTLAAHIEETMRYCRSIAVLGEATVRALDLVAGMGERLSSVILAAALRERGLHAEAVPATELIVTDAHFGAAQPDLEASRPRVQARLLICHGADDPFVKPEALAAFKAGTAKLQVQFESYPGAMHGFTNPEADARKIPGLAYQKEAAEKSWNHFRAFLAEIFR